MRGNLGDSTTYGERWFAYKRVTKQWMLLETVYVGIDENARENICSSFKVKKIWKNNRKKLKFIQDWFLVL